MSDAQRNRLSAGPGFLARGLATLFLSLVFSTFAIAQQHARVTAEPPYFAAPVSGKKVSSYTVDLATKAEARTFEVPNDCSEIIGQLKANNADRSRVLDRRLWFKVEHDCRYYGLLHRYPNVDLADHVTRVDFFNLALDQLPLHRSCVDDQPNQCSLWLVDAVGTRHRISPNTLGRQAEDCETRQIPCRLVNGVIRGEIRPTPDGMACLPDRRTSLRLLSIDYGDVNGDGILDAVLRLMQISAEEGRQILRIPVTRLRPDGALITPTRTSNTQD